jgi:hypothetical protein
LLKNSTLNVLFERGHRSGRRGDLTVCSLRRVIKR